MQFITGNFTLQFFQSDNSWSNELPASATSVQPCEHFSSPFLCRFFIAHYFIVINLHVFVGEVEWINLPFPRAIARLFTLFNVHQCTLLFGVVLTLFRALIFDFFFSIFAESNVQKAFAVFGRVVFVCAHEIRIRKRWWGNALNHMSGFGRTWQVVPWVSCTRRYQTQTCRTQQRMETGGRLRHSIHTKKKRNENKATRTGHDNVSQWASWWWMKFNFYLIYAQMLKQFADIRSA